MGQRIGDSDEGQFLSWSDRTVDLDPFQLWAALGPDPGATGGAKAWIVLFPRERSRGIETISSNPVTMRIVKFLMHDEGTS